ncbi:recombinase family protein [Bacillus cereus group sp. N12]|uniref:recombinase family protein n=1 Tax=Bacillus cereus group sp. N12 TaxID=2794586 RepID=UPI0027DD76FD|nr:recombinase family protein [Bacillus cereus group sp. N12]
MVSLDYNFDTRTATGKKLFHIIGAVTEWERELLKEKQRAGLDIAKKRVGSWVGQRYIVKLIREI